MRDRKAARQASICQLAYGSEFGFDTTGQEEVVVWNLYFGNEDVAKKTVDHVLSYMRNSPTWAYHGGARSWGDIGNNGKYLATFGTGVADRGQMHYRSGLNMIPLIEWYRLSNSGGGSLSVTFAAAAECDKFRLKLTKTARARPGSGFAVAHAPLVRGAYEIAPAAGGGATVVTVTYGN